MLRILLLTLVCIVAVSDLSTRAAAQAHQPYAGLQGRTIKALSERQLSDLRAGRGMELALAAELNGYPGPAHVIELAPQLDLSAAQLESVKRLHDDMKAEAKALGERLIAEEAALDRQFAERTVTQASLHEATGQIAGTLGQLRAAHLRYHLNTIDLLSPQQTRLYSQLRGYAGESARPNQHHHKAN